MISRRKFFSNAAVAVGVTALGAATRSMQGAEPGGTPSENPIWESESDGTSSDPSSWLLLEDH
jgi:hypothetical protein